MPSKRITRLTALSTILFRLIVLCRLSRLCRHPAFHCCHPDAGRDPLSGVGLREWISFFNGMTVKVGGMADKVDGMEDE